MKSALLQSWFGVHRFLQCYNNRDSASLSDARVPVLRYLRTIDICWSLLYSDSVSRVNSANAGY